MDWADFGTFLRRGGRSPQAAARCIRHVQDFELYLKDHRDGTDLEDADAADLEQFVAWIEREPKASAKTQLWALGYYLEYTANEELRALAGSLRGQRIKRKPFALNKFRGVDPAVVDKLASVGIRNVVQMRESGRTHSNRQALAERIGVPIEAILELVKLSDLARIQGLKAIRARLYYDAGVDTLEQLAGWEPEELWQMLVGFVASTGFGGIAPLPKEAASAVVTARRLTKVIEY